MPEHKRSDEDLLTAQQIAEQYGLDPRVAESIVRNLGRKGKLVETPIRRRIVRRGDAFPERKAT